jgi:hypothetical protein
VVEADPQPLISDTLDELGEEAEYAFVAGLIVERRQDQHARSVQL